MRAGGSSRSRAPEKYLQSLSFKVQLQLVKWELKLRAFGSARTGAAGPCTTEGEGEVIATLATDSLSINGRYASTIWIIIGTAQIVRNPFLQSGTPGHIALDNLRVDAQGPAHTSTRCLEAALRCHRNYPSCMVTPHGHPHPMAAIDAHDVSAEATLNTSFTQQIHVLKQPSRQK
ncbi:hypothetical protein HCDG_03624 [Histoplasma capsulatum H143]|uniref:Uncharacterized protein n=1 Tax=Ajellomyces capsulatus (strain H143) TaxID=544712 RepID=C6HC75_AJECH|nr:hypothetical protein HCDG_03624 [Histoplasma capsulatum H143]